MTDTAQDELLIQVRDLRMQAARISALIEDEVVAAEYLFPYRVVTSGGKLADSTNPAHFQRVMGVTLNVINPGFRGRIAVSGERVTNPDWTWTPSEVIFLNGMNLGNTVNSIGFIQRIGLADSAQSLILMFGEPIQL